MRRLARSKRGSACGGIEYELRRRSRLAASQPSCASRDTLVRSSRSLTPNGASSSIRLPSHTVPPCGATASPKIVITSDLERGGSLARKWAIHSVLVSCFIEE